MRVHIKDKEHNIEHYETGSKEEVGRYTLTPVWGKDINKIAEIAFFMIPCESYIRTTPNDGEWLVFKFENYNSEGRIRIERKNNLV